MDENIQGRESEIPEREVHGLSSFTSSPAVNASQYGGLAEAKHSAAELVLL